jgi:hypothetical protein
MPEAAVEVLTVAAAEPVELAAAEQVLMLLA